MSNVIHQLPSSLWVSPAIVAIYAMMVYAMQRKSIERFIL